MEYRNLGRSGLKVSEISLGSWLTYGNVTQKKSAFACLDAAVEAGVNLIDTADIYAKGEAEKVIGEWLATQRRQSIVLATKCYAPMGPTPNDRGGNRKHIMEACESSLDRLGIDYIDLYQLHRYDRTTPLEETIEAFSDLVKAGMIHYWGVSMWSAVEITNAVRLAEKHGWVKPVSNQPIYNMINRSLEVDVMEVCENEGIGMIVFSPLAQGILTGKYSKSKAPKGSRAAHKMTAMMIEKRLTEGNIKMVDELARLAKKQGLTVSQLALAWNLRKSCLSSVITGATRAEQVKENVQATGVKLDGQILAKIEEILGNHPRDQYTGLPTGHGAPKTEW